VPFLCPRQKKKKKEKIKKENRRLLLPLCHVAGALVVQLSQSRPLLSANASANNSVGRPNFGGIKKRQSASHIPVGNKRPKQTKQKK
jgi:hypothetical protein